MSEVEWRQVGCFYSFIMGFEGVGECGIIIFKSFYEDGSI